MTLVRLPFFKYNGLENTQTKYCAPEVFQSGQFMERIRDGHGAKLETHWWHS